LGSSFVTAGRSAGHGSDGAALCPEHRDEFTSRKDITETEWVEFTRFTYQWFEAPVLYAF
jgi:hypothetical protein